MPSQDDENPELIDLLMRHRDSLVRIVERKGSGLMRFESAEDLVQGIHIHALKVAEHFDYRGDAAFIGWLSRIALQHIADRNRYWKAQKRHASRMLRITSMGGKSTFDPGGIEPAALGKGASTFAMQREQLIQATKAMAVLLPRDQQLIRWMCEGLTIQQMADQLEISYGAAERARLRAEERFRKAALALESRRPDSSS